MGLWDRLRAVFVGGSSALVVRDPNAPLAVSDAARARLAGLGPDRGVHLETTPAQRGRLVSIREGASQGPPPPGFDLPLTASDADLTRLRGRTLDWDGERWKITIPLELRARETPNPESRLYLCDQVLGTGRAAFYVPGTEDLPDLAARLLEVTGVRSILVRDNTVTVEREPNGPAWDAVDRGVDAALREHLLLCGAPIDGGLPDEVRSAIEEEIRQILVERVLPAVHRDGGDIELVGYANGVVKVSMHGACRSCPASSATLRLGVEKTLRDALPGKVERIEAV